MSLRTYVYTPQPPGVDVFWASAAHVHHYLICSTGERARIMADVQNMEPGQPFSVLIIHPCLRKYLFLSTVETDETFLAHLTRHFIGDLNTWYYQSCMATVSFINFSMQNMTHSSFPKSHSEYAIDFSAMPARTYVYTPQPYGIDLYWKVPTQMYWYLMNCVHERLRILSEIRSFEDNHTFSVILVHRCLPRYVTISTNDSDEDFLRYLKALYLYELDG